MQNGVQIAHQNEGNLHLVLDFLQLVKKQFHTHAVLEGLRGSTLDNRTVSKRVAKRNANLDEVDTPALHRQDDIARTFKCRTTGTEIETEELFVATIGENLVYLVHNYNRVNGELLG